MVKTSNMTLFNENEMMEHQELLIKDKEAERKRLEQQEAADAMSLIVAEGNDDAAKIAQEGVAYYAQ